ncbi:exodeoxyribonuclease V subunit gamma [Desulforhopalus sp. IMCC35007]|uniref:exodeoxyribonuclease V subunit gamma n=1 Tax=Desulforhopalus sp. IMCC35007 TaxID=2569543 RepID=UPI0010ADB44F|nr:exodeoxyribonuclease V subunit gamma [Desulforhopalus sp. IMCC35007]TKB08013.1 exodeoxyribonuclease V subunit gamma [Desulforhopalus sp. IMCC35007]
MFYLHVSNRTENLLHQLAEVIRIDKQPDLFSGELFLIQSQGMERMVCQTLADEFASLCNFAFSLPLDFLSSIADRLNMGISPDGFQRQTLTFRIEQLLTEIDDEVYKPLQYYLQGEKSNLKRFQLSRRLANVFDQYQLMRSDMLLSWEKGVLTTNHASEPWQMMLWRRLTAQPGGNVHRGMLFQSLIEELQTQTDLSRLLPKRIAVIGLHTMPPLFLQFLGSLAIHMDVHFFLLSPCRHYWGDVQTKKQLFKKKMHLVGEGAEDIEDEDHPLLASLGRQGKDLQIMMLEGADFALEFASYQSPVGDGDYQKACLLHRVQADILEGCLPENSPEFSWDDHSIQIVSCHSRRRELMVLRDQLLHLLHTKPDLELRDIVVMAPDIQEYAPIIPALFSDIQHSVADRSVRRRNSVFAGFLAFLELFSGRFGWSEVLDILRLPAILPQFDLTSTDFETIEYWVREAGIRWGLSASQRQDAGVQPFSENSWRAGLDRMLMGYATASEDFVGGILPFTELEGRGASALGGLCRFIDVVEEARIALSEHRSLAGWSEVLLSYVSQLFGDDNESELIELRSLIADLGRTMEEFPESELDFEVIREWFIQSAQEKRTSSGFMRGQLTFCSMLPMRSIPFRVVCLLGLNDGIYPKPDTHDNFDLMGTSGKFRLGDRSARADDRYQFLEAIIATRDNLYLSYIGQSVLTNEKVPPSVIITELLELLENHYKVKGLIVHHPLHSFSKKYFTGSRASRLKSYDAYACQVADKLSQERPAGQAWWQGSLEPPEKEVSVHALLSFFNNPQKYFVRQCLGVFLSGVEEFPEDRETFYLEGLARYHAEQALIEAELAAPEKRDEAGQEFLRKAQIAGRWPLGTVGKLSYLLKKKEIGEFIETVNAAALGQKCSDHPVDLMVGDYHLHGSLGNVYEQGILIIRYGKLRGRDLVSGWLHHLLLNAISSGSKRTSIVTKDISLSFAGIQGGPELDYLLDLFHAGHCQPSQLYVEPAFVYAEQLRKNTTVPPLDKARGVMQEAIDRGYEPEMELLLKGRSQESWLGPEFEELSQAIMAALLENADD